MSETGPRGAYVYQPHPVSRKDGLLWAVGGLPTAMSREDAQVLAEAINRAMTDPERCGSARRLDDEENNPVPIGDALERLRVQLSHHRDANFRLGALYALGEIRRLPAVRALLDAPRVTRN